MSDGTFYAGVRISHDLPPGIVRDPHQIEQLMAAHLVQSAGRDGPVRKAWLWALTGKVISPISLSAPPGLPPSPAEIRNEALASVPEPTSAEADGEVELARLILTWLIGETNELPAPGSA